MRNAMSPVSVTVIDSCGHRLPNKTGSRRPLNGQHPKRGNEGKFDEPTTLVVFGPNSSL